MTHIREKLAWSLVAALGLLIAASIAGIVRGGPLDPTTGPQSTDGVRTAGTPISSLPFTTTAGGYYYVTGPLSAGFEESGITICCSNTTVDLGGFTITGGQAPGDGIYNAGARNIVIRNGAIRSFNYGINLGGTYSRIENIQALSNSVVGISVGPGSVIVNCNVSLTPQTGVIVSYATVRNCTMMENGTGILAGAYSLVEGNRVNSNTGIGIATGGNFSTIRNNIADNNLGSDISATSAGIVVSGNVYCDRVFTGSNLVDIGNVDRVDAC